MWHWLAALQARGSLLLVALLALLALGLLEVWLLLLGRRWDEVGDWAALSGCTAFAVAAQERGAQLLTSYWRVGSARADHTNALSSSDVRMVAAVPST